MDKNELLQSLFSAAETGNYSNGLKSFDTLMKMKIGEKMEERKMQLASRMFSEQPAFPEDEEPYVDGDLDFEDEPEEEEDVPIEDLEDDDVEDYEDDDEFGDIPSRDELEADLGDLDAAEDELEYDDLEDDEYVEDENEL